MKNLPNAITLLRLLLVPVIAVLLAEQRFAGAFAVFAIGAVSDGIDGWLARRLNAESQVGVVLDPVADKLFVISTAFVLAWEGLLPLWLAMALVARDVLILAPLLIDPKFKDQWPSPNRAGKAHTALALLTLAATIAHGARWIDAPALLLALQVVLTVSIVVSLALYARAWLSGGLIR
ncbi:MAG TPA: CDP-alcohol phosphatidyltransferase family protein [Burkholderiales bacterium]|nr:CDP-alcohol phosphatidyltransferase family protein [Burkholderiales bacterium]